MDVQAARDELADRIHWCELMTPDPQLVERGRARDRLVLRRLELRLDVDQLQAIRDLPDADLAWLLSVGWSPGEHRRPT